MIKNFVKKLQMGADIKKTEFNFDQSRLKFLRSQQI
jgi:hypothetical protein